MQSLVVYFSQHGNTRSVAEAVAEGLRAAGPVQVMGIDQLSEPGLQGADLVVVGSPTYRMNLPEVVRTALAGLPRRVLRDKRVAAFDTSYKMSRWLAPFTAARKLARKLRKLGGSQVVPPETYLVEGREGPLHGGELERASEWAALIVQQLQADGS